MSHRYRSRTKRTLLVVATLLLLTTLLTAFTAQAEKGSASRLTQVVAAQASDGILAVVGANGAPLHDRPAGDVVFELGIGTTLTAVGRTGDSRWVMVMTDGDDVGWAEADDLVLFGIAELPVLVDDLSTAEMEPTATDEAMGEEGEDLATETPSPTPVPPTATPTNTATPSPSPTPVPPTATFTPTPVPTATPTMARTSGRAATTVVAVAGSGGAMLYDGPDGSEQYTLATGTAMTANARSDDGEWVSIRTATEDIGWVAVDDVVIFNVVSLPVVEGADAMAEAETGDGERMDADMAGDEAADQMSDDEMASDELAAVDDDDQASAEDAVAAAEPVEEAEPTATSTAKPTERATPRPTPVVGEDDITATVILTGSRLNVRSGPGTGYRIVAKAYPDEVFLALGRNGAGDWIQIDVPDMGDVGWVSADLVRTSDPIVDLPVIDGESGTATSSSEPEDGQVEEEPAILPSPTAAPQSQAEQAPVAASTGPTGLSGTLVFSTGGERGDIYIYDLDSGSLRFLTNGYEPAISPDSSQVAFIRFGSEPGIYAINIDGGNERLVFGEREALTSPKWSPDGQKIVFSRFAGTYSCHNLGFGMCVSEGRLCPKFEDPETGEKVRISCLPDELKVEKPQFALARVNANGDEYRDLNSLTTARAPNWHEGGIVYDASTGIEITDDTPAAKTQSIVKGRYYQDAEWQPGGNQIIFHAREGSHWELFAVNRDGSGLTAWTKPVTTLVENLPSNVSPAWSPDGAHVVYLSSRDDQNDRGSWRLWVMDAGGGNQRPLPIDVPFDYSFGHDQIVSWGL